ncbi:MAG: hypothetical protein WAV74_18115 [Anaerolineae bacterium]|jgi:hypothetical protein
MKKRYVLLLIPSILVLAALSLDLGLACENLLVYPIYMVGGLFGLLAVIIGIGLGVRAGRKGLFFVVLCVAVIGAYALLPNILDWRQSLEFVWKRAGYMEVIDLVREGNIKPGDKSLAEIDSDHRYLLPCTSQIAIEDNSRGLFVIFFTSNRMFGEFSGHMYVEDGQAPSVQQFRELRALGPEQWSHIKRVDANWFYVIWSH